MKILFADKFPEDGLLTIRGMGYECDYQPDLTAESLPGAIAGSQILVVRSTGVTAATIDASDVLAMVIRAGAGTNTIDKAAAAQRGIYVSNVPGKNALAVAELAMGLILAIDRNIPDNVADLRAEAWNKSKWSKTEGIHGRTLGIIGLGDIGLAVAERAAAFGMELIAVQRQGRDPMTARRIEDLDIQLVPDVHQLAEASDIVTVHVPYNDQTHHLVDASFLDHMKPKAVLINTSRGEVVDESALLAAMNEKDVRAGLDVFWNEPKDGIGTFTSALAQHPNTYGTHHIGASTEQAQRAIASGVVDILTAFSRGRALNAVNLASDTLSAATVTIRHYDKVGVLAEVLGELRKAHLNVEQMDNTIFDGAHAAVATIHVAGEVPADLGDRLNALDNVIYAAVRRSQ